MFDFPGGQAAAFFATFAAGGVGYFIFRFMRLPSPALLGAITVTGVLSATGFYPKFPLWIVYFIANTMIGIMLGKQINRSSVRQVLSLARLVFIQLIGVLALSLLCGVIMYALSASEGVSLATALISGTAGGISEMMIFGMSLHADLAAVAFVHFFRLVAILWLIPYMSVIIEKMCSSKKTAGAVSKVERALLEEKLSLSKFLARDYVLMSIFAFTGSFIGNWLRIPTGAMLGAAFGGGVFAIAVNKKYEFHSRLGLVAQIGIGLVMGERVTPQIVSQASTLLISAVLLTLVMAAGSIFLAALLYKMSDLDLQTCLLCVVPAGVNQTPIFAEEFGADAFTASIFQTVRLLGIVSFYPWIVMPFV